MPFFGRQREIWIAQSIIDSRVGAACLFVGGPGVGKSALMRQIAEEHDTVVVVASPNERLWPYSGLSAVASALGGARGAAVDGLLGRGRDWPEHLLAEELSRTLHLVHDEPCVLVVDDLDDMDAASITVLSYVFGRLRGTGISLLATVGRLEGRHAFTGLAHTEIAPLAFEESVDLARSLLGPGAVRAVLHIVAAFTGGNPAVIGRVRLTPDEASGAEPLPLPLRLSDEEGARGRRGRRSSPAGVASDVMDLLSVGPVFDLDRLRDEAGTMDAELDDLIESGVVAVRGGLARIADPAERLRLHAALPAEERRRLHARAASAHAVASPATRRWHESFLAPVDGAGVALLEAAADLARLGDPSSAVEFAERGLRHSMDTDGRTRCLVDLGDALVRHGHFVLGQHYLRRADDPADAHARARAALAQLRATAVVDHVVDDTVVDHALGGSSAGDAERILAEAAGLRIGRGELDQATERVAEAHERGVASLEIALLTRILEETGCLPSPTDAVDSAAVTTPVGPDAPIEEAHLMITVHELAEDYAAARHLAWALLDRTPRLPPLWRERVLARLVSTEVRAGDASAARDAVSAWRREWLPGRSPDAASVLLLAGAAALDPDGGDVDGLVRRGRALCRREGTPALLPAFGVIDGGRALAEGRYADAVLALQAARDASPCDDPSMVRVDADLIEALWLDGRRAEARVELTRLERDAARHPRRWTTLAVARARAVCRSAEAGSTAFREAEDVYRTDDAPDEHLRLIAARERCLPSESRRPAPAARAPHTRSLTAQEQEVVVLVGRGMRNREIASTLFVSLRTVELRLTNIYRKLGVSSRVQLVSRVGRTAAEE
ncbi:LuxR C-terminal-related transcriptional regulator [Microbacterium enclense]|uniref:helix-turn-helix transcriptional regulator n=1 Tax=Microbacterium enclense TaxID=993073 RepID=UPI0036DB8A3E